MSRSFGRVAAVFTASVALVSAAPQTQPPSFQAGTRTVAVYATVTNPRGRLVPDLSREDFAVDDNGKRQTLTLFANDIQPITLVMLLDRSGSMKPNFELEEQAAEAFVRAMLPDDKARIGSFGNRIQIDPPEFTSDRDALIRILRTELQEDGPTPLWNAVNTAIDKLLLEPGRRVVLVFTDGVDKPMNFSNHNKSLKDVMKRAEEDNIMVYAIGLAGQNGMPDFARARRRPRPGAGPGRHRRVSAVAGSAAMAADSRRWRNPTKGCRRSPPRLAAGTSSSTSPRDLASTFARVADELHHQYALGFTPEKLDGKMHDIAVHLSNPDYTARARKRYLASKPMGG